MFEIQKLDSVIGAIVSNFSLTSVPDDDTIKALESALERFGVLVFPQQNVTPEQLVDFSVALGPLELTELEDARLDGVEEIFVVGNVGKGLVSFSPETEGQELEWHTDHIHRDVPARASLLYAKEVPEKGGDTLFSCMYNAYDNLSESDKQAYCKLEMIHSASGLDEYLAKQNLDNSKSQSNKRIHKHVIRPLVREHPVTKRRALYFGNQITVGVVGWEQHRARRFVADLTDHACQEGFQYRHQWKANDAVLWDNRRVLHAGTPYDVNNTRRLMHRTTIRETESIDLVKL